MTLIKPWALPGKSNVRIAWNEAPRFKRVLDLGAAGIMVPYVNTAEEAKKAAEAMRYPPEGVRGVDVLFIGPLDLSVNLGIAQQFEHQNFIEAMDSVAAACKNHGKAAGILVPNLDYLPLWIEKGFTFFVVGSDGGCVAKGLQDIYATYNTFK